MSGHDADMATARDTDTAITVTTTEAARIAGVSPRTIRRWIQQGWLVSIDGPNGQEVSPADLTEAAQRAKQGRGHDRGHGHHPPVTDADAATDTAIAARGQLDAVMQEWLAPLVDRIGKLERENGRLEQERDSQAETIAALRRQLAEARSAPPAAPQPASAAPTPSAHDAPRSLLRPYRASGGGCGGCSAGQGEAYAREAMPVVDQSYGDCLYSSRSSGVAVTGIRPEGGRRWDARGTRCSMEPWAAWPVRRR